MMFELIELLLLCLVWFGWFGWFGRSIDRSVSIESMRLGCSKFSWADRCGAAPRVRAKLNVLVPLHTFASKCPSRSTDRRNPKLMKRHGIDPSRHNRTPTKGRGSPQQNRTCQERAACAPRERSAGSCAEKNGRRVVGAHGPPTAGFSSSSRLLRALPLHVPWLASDVVSVRSVTP